MTRAPGVARLLEIAWREGDLAVRGSDYDRTARPDDAPSLHAQLGQSGRPLVVYVWNPETDAKARDEFEAKALGDDDVAVLAKWFDCVRLPVASLGEKLDKQTLKGGEGFLVLDGSGELVGRVAGQVKAKALVAAMSKAYQNTYRQGAKAAIDSYIAFLRKLEQKEDAVALKQKAIADLATRLSGKPSASGDKQKAELEAELVQLREELAAVQAEGAALLEPKSEGRLAAN